MTSGNSVLIVVDMQNWFISSKSAPVVPKVVDLANKWEDLGRDVVFTRFFNHPRSQFERLVEWSRFMPGGNETEIIPELAKNAARAAAVIDKVGQYSPFTDEFTRLVNLQGWTNMVICGIATESCVMKTACDAFEKGYTPRVVTDASASHAGVEPHEAGLLVIKRFIGRKQLIDTEVVFDGSILTTT